MSLIKIANLKMTLYEQRSHIKIQLTKVLEKKD